MYYCIVCGQKMVWRCDYDPEDLGYTGAGIVMPVVVILVN